MDQLTSRERACLALAARGLTNQQIARVLGCGAEAVHRDLGVAYQRLNLEGVGNPRALAVAMWAQDQTKGERGG